MHQPETIAPETITLEHIRTETRTSDDGHDGRPYSYPVHVYRARIADPAADATAGETVEAPAIVRQFCTPHGDYWTARRYYPTSGEEGDELADAPSFRRLRRDLAGALAELATPYAVGIEASTYDPETDEASTYRTTVYAHGWSEPGEAAAAWLERRRDAETAGREHEIEDVYGQ